MISRDDKIWIAENLMRNCEPEGIKDALVSIGRDAKEVEREIAITLFTPQFIGALRGRDLFQRRANKANWVLSTIASHKNNINKVDFVENNNVKDIFFDDYYYQNKPVLIEKCVIDWPAYKNWDPDYLIKNWGDKEVSIQSNRESDPDYEENKAKFETKINFGDFLTKIRDVDSNDLYLTAFNNKDNIEQLQSMWDETQPLPEILDPEIKPSGFFFIGSKGTITPTHHDLTNNLLVQIRGSKKIWMVDSLNLPNIYCHVGVFSKVDLSNIDYEKFPLMKEVKVLEVVLKEGDALFVPIGWWHMVKALDFSITSTYTNFKANNDYSSLHQESVGAGGL
jgi:hypothetical protein